MKLFGFGKKVEQKCNCNGTCAQTSKIMVLGACCKKASESFENVQKAAKELGIDEVVVNVSDHIIIAQYGVMSTPALVIHDEVITSGTYISVAEAKQLLEQHYVNQ